MFIIWICVLKARAPDIRRELEEWASSRAQTSDLPRGTPEDDSFWTTRFFNGVDWLQEVF